MPTAIMLNDIILRVAAPMADIRKSTCGKLNKTFLVIILRNKLGCLSLLSTTLTVKRMGWSKLGQVRLTTLDQDENVNHSKENFYNFL